MHVHHSTCRSDIQSIRNTNQLATTQSSKGFQKKKKIVLAHGTKKNRYNMFVVTFGIISKKQEEEEKKKKKKKRKKKLNADPI